MPKIEDKEFLLGGQAVIEGVMMRSPNYYTVAVRKENGDIVVRRKHQPRLIDRNKFLGLPFIRGIVMLGQTLSIGMKALNFSAEVLTREEKKAKSKENTKGEMSGWGKMLMFGFAFLMAFALVVFLPLSLTDLVVGAIPALSNSLAYNTIDGLFRVLFFLSYIFLISLMPDIRRVFQYHGAEHMSVYASEREEEISVETARGHSPYHPRCGTSFLLLVMLVAIAVFSFTPHQGAFWIKLLIRTPLIPVIAGVSYEVLRLTAKLSRHRLFSVLSAPGMWLQRLTARKPDDQQLAVAVAALNQVMQLELEYRGNPLPPDNEEILLAAEH